MSKRVCIFVRNEFTVDARVLKTARTIASDGHETLVVALGGRDLPEIETHDLFTVKRVSPVLTWADAFPRLARGGRPATSPKTTSPAGPREAAAAAEATSPGGLVRWALTGRGTPPRSWTAGAAGPAARLLFALRLLARVPAQRSRRAYRVATRRARRAGIRTRRRVLRPTRFRQIERRMAREAIAFAPDVCWSNDADTLRPAAATARRCKARLVYDAHEVIWDVPQLSWWYKLRWAIVEATHVRRADAVVTVADPIADLMARRYRIPRPAVVINCPPLAASQSVSPRDASPLKAYRKDGEKIVLYHGHLAPHRGIEQLIRATRHLPKGVRAAILGQGFHRDALQDLIVREGLSDRVTMIPAVPPDELLAWVAGADVGMVSHVARGRNQEFAMPNKLFECMHLGVPVVASDARLIAQTVRDVGFGIVTDTGNANRVAEAIEKILGDPARYEEMRTNALAGAKRYCWENQEATILTLLGGDHQNV